MSGPHSGAAPRAAGRKAGAAAVVATGALACGVCCVLPFAMPAALLAASGGALAWLGGLYGLATKVAVAAVVLAWAWVAQQSLRTRRRPSRATLATLSIATAIMVAALLWPKVEAPVRTLLSS